MATEYILSVYIFYYYTYIRLYKLYCIFKLRVYIVNALITVSHRAHNDDEGK